MDDKSRQRFDAIVKKEPAALTEGDIVFLRARQDYLTDEQKSVFASVLEEPKPSKRKKDEDGEE